MKWWNWLLIAWAALATVGCLVLALVVKDLYDEDAAQRDPDR